MTENIKKYSLITGLVIAVLLTISVWRFADSYSKSIEPTSFRSFTTTGEAKVVAVPDVAAFTFSVLTEGGKDIAALQEDNTGKINKAISFLKAKGVDAKDISTSGYNLEPRYQYSSCPSSPSGVSVCPPPTIVGYRIQQTVSVKVRDFAKAGEILSGVVSEGANTVSQLSFTVDDPVGLQNEARAKAIENAKERAKTLAKAGGFKIGRLLSIEDGTPVYPFYDRTATLGLEAAKVAPTPAAIEPGSQEIKVTVTLRYEID